MSARWEIYPVVERGGYVGCPCPGLHARRIRKEKAKYKRIIRKAVLVGMIYLCIVAIVLLGVLK